MRSRLASFSLPEAVHPLALLGVCVLAYGLLVPYLGFYWDDFPLAWIASQLGPEGLARYFSTNRPIWGLLFQVTTPLFGTDPALWQIFAIGWRWAAAVSLWVLLRQVWPGLPRLAAWASLLFAVYPGFGQQFIALVYSHFFIVLTAFLLSLYLNVLAVRKKRFFLPLTAAALLLSVANLLMMEYFFLLELVRPLLLWFTLEKHLPAFRERAWKTIFHSLPYLAVFLGAGIWRAFFFSYQTQNYQPQLFGELSPSPGGGLLELAGRILLSLWDGLVGAWLQAFTLPNPAVLGGRTALAAGLLAALALAGGLLYLSIFRPAPLPARRKAWGGVLTGGFAAIISSLPFWMIGMRPSLLFPLDRFTLPMMFGACLLLAGLLLALPLRSWMQVGMMALLVAVAVGYQFQLANQYRRDWETQKRFFWQLAWRIPSLEENTLVLANDLPVTFYSDNSLTAPLNWIYTPTENSTRMGYLLYYPSVRLGGQIHAMRPGERVEQDYLAAKFSGNTDQIVGVFYDPPACLRVLDPAIDPHNRMLPQAIRNAAVLSTTAPVLAEARAFLPEQLFGPEPARSWCYYFNKADLARQVGDWEAAAALGDHAFALGDYPNDPAERIPFIDGYAHTGRWDDALEQTAEAAAITPMMQLPLCRVWQRIGENTPTSLEQEKALEAAYTMLNCRP